MLLNQTLEIVLHILKDHVLDQIFPLLVFGEEHCLNQKMGT